jgi:predicted acyltransferase
MDTSIVLTAGTGPLFFDRIGGMVEPAPAAARVSSLDAFRGLTMALMVVVNNPGTWSAVYWPLEHAEWNGWTPTDLVFPFFVFIVGVSLTLSRQTLGAPWWRLARRGLVIIGCGLFMAGFPFFNPVRWRIPGVLQRIGVCYLAAAFAFRWTSGRRRQAAILAAGVAAILLVYWFVLTRSGDLTAEGNLGARIDRALMSGHLWRRAWDPEGLLSTLPAIATALVGVLAGLWMRSPAAPAKKIWALAGAGLVLFVAGEIWGASFPINKSLWTSSYVLVTAGAAALLLAAFMYVIDVRGYTRWNRPLVVLGSNALTLFVLSGLVAKLMILIKVTRADGEVASLQGLVYERGFAWMGAPKNASLLFSLAFLGIMYGVLYALYRRRIFLKA